jgi:hypothetical protein
MNKVLTVALLALSAIATPALHAETAQEIEATCRAYAAQDGVSPSELKDYLAECMASLSDPEEDPNAPPPQD